MSDGFPLIKKLEQLHKDPKCDESPLPKGVKYEQRIIMVEDSEEVTIFIPLREATAFDQAISEQGKYISRHDFSVLLRTYRGIRNWE
jgi:hypothetical protein